jgi:hypothetical protein
MATKLLRPGTAYTPRLITVILAPLHSFPAGKMVVEVDAEKICVYKDIETVVYEGAVYIRDIQHNCVVFHEALLH